MSEKEGTIQSLKQLAKDSINLVEKCRKPDKKGIFKNPGADVILYRIRENYAILCYWFCCYGCHWLFD